MKKSVQKQSPEMAKESGEEKNLCSWERKDRNGTFVEEGETFDHRFYLL